MMEFIVSSEYKVASSIWKLDEDFVDLNKIKIRKWFLAAGDKKKSAGYMGSNLVLIYLCQEELLRGNII